MVFTGGAPLYRRDFMQILEHARNRRFAVQLLTAATDVSAVELERMADMGLDAVQISLYGPSADFHDVFVRRSGAFESAWNALLTLKNLGVSVRAAISVMPENRSLVEKTVNLLRENDLGWNFNYVMLPERGQRKPDRSLQLDDERLTGLLRRYPPEGPRRMAGLECHDGLCSAGRAQLAVDPYGNVFPCMMWREKAGNLREMPLVDIWETSPVMEKARTLMLCRLEDCPDCNLKQSCNRCSGLAWAEGLDIRQHSELDCRLAKIYSSLKCE